MIVDFIIVGKKNYCEILIMLLIKFIEVGELKIL